MKAHPIASIFVLTAVLAVAQGADTPDALVLSIRPVEAVVKAGSDVGIWIKLTNNSNKAVDLSASISNQTGVDPNFEYDVRDDRGSAVARKIHSHPELASGSAKFARLEPGQSTEFSEGLSGLLEFPNPGIYTIQLRRTFQDFPETGVSTLIKSNRIMVRVEPGSKTGPPLDETVPEFTLKDAIFVDGVSALSLKARAHIGLEEIIREKIMDPKDRRIQFSLHLENKSVREILDTLCQSDARYMWSVDGETINIYPRTASGDSSYLFNLALDEVKLDAVTDPDHALIPLARKLRNQQIGYMGVGLGDDEYPSPWTTSFENLSVRQFTNRIAEHMGEHTSWIWQGGRDERMFTFLKGGFYSESDTAVNLNATK